MVLMVLPFVFVGSVVFWRSRVPTVSTTGPPKIVVGEARLIESTPLNVGTGYNVRIKISLQLLGAAPASGFDSFSAGSAHSLDLEYQLKGQWRRVARDRDGMFLILKWMDDRAQNQSESRSLPWQIPLSFADVPRQSRMGRFPKKLTHDLILLRENDGTLPIRVFTE